MKNGRRTAMLTAPVGQTLTNLTIPTVFGLLGMVAFNLADTFFVGQLGTQQLAAMSFTFPVVMVVLSIANGIGQGGGALIAHAIGEGDQAKVQRITTDLILLALLIVIVLASVGVLTVEPLFGALGAPPEILALIRQYMFIWYIMIVVVLVPMIGNLAIRATGDAKTPSMVMMVAVVVNFALDPLLIFGWGPIPRLELVGAALATALSRVVTLVYALYVLYVRDEMLTLAWPGWRALLDSWRQILAIGIPAAATNMITPLSMGLITRLVATHGVAAVAALGVASRIDMLALVVILALGNVLGPFVGQNWGAAEYGRARQGIRLSQQFAVAWGLLMVLLLAPPGRWIAALFNDDPQVVENVVLYLWIVPLSYGLQGVLRLAAYTLNVLNKALYSMMLTLVQMFVLYIPLAYIGSSFMGLPGIFGAATIAHMAAGVIGFWILQQTVATEEEQQVAAAAGVAAD
ncbi:MAG: MATE family efflux transporter [Caldilineaceae bacterium]|nr:MATE family efflux transporter [Caldilineaceae bacterium]